MRLAILEDNEEHSALLREWLTAAGHNCHVYARGKDFLRDVARESFEMMLIDWEVPDLSGEAVTDVDGATHTACVDPAVHCVDGRCVQDP